MKRVLKTMGLAVAAMITVPPLLAAQYSAIDLGTLGGAGLINERGQIVGGYNTEFGDRAFLWQHGVMTDLGTLDEIVHEFSPPPIVNPSFEADTFTIWPGYVWHNGPITGWGGGWVWGHGVNPGTFGGPFTDNGVIPDGTKAAFLQEDGVLNQVISGFSVGATYQVRYFENARDCCSGTAPFVEVRIGGSTIVAPHIVTPVGGSNPYREVISDPFVATSTELELAFIKSNPQGGDTTLLIDNVSITPGKLIFSFIHTYADDMNEHGQIAGRCFTDQFIEHGFVWQNGVMTDLGTLAGFDNSSAYDINECGQVVGYSYDGASGQASAFLWQEGVMTDLGGNGSIAFAINNRSQVVGVSVDSASGEQYAFLWENGVMSNLGGSFSAAFFINERGQVVGTTYDVASGGQHAFLWHRGVMTDLGTLGGSSVYPSGINESGQIVGNSTTASGEDHAFVWQQGVMTDLGTLGGCCSYASAINERGQIVGNSFTASGEQHAFLWQESVMADLGTLAGDNSSLALDINERGQIVGYGSPDSGGYHAILWTK